MLVSFSRDIALQERLRDHLPAYITEVSKIGEWVRPDGRVLGRKLTCCILGFGTIQTIARSALR